MSEPVRHTPTSGLFPNSQNVAEILTLGMLSRDTPFVGLPAKTEEAPAATEAKLVPHNPLRENISKHKGPHLAREKNNLFFAIVLLGAKGKNRSSPLGQHRS